jgi:hypothetical protein
VVVESEQVEFDIHIFQRKLRAARPFTPKKSIKHYLKPRPHRKMNGRIKFREVSAVDFVVTLVISTVQTGEYQNKLAFFGDSS